LPHPLPNEKDGEFPPEEREIKTDKSGNIHALVGKTDFTTEQLTENYKIISSKITNMRPLN
jgi:ribosomal protein L1